LDQAALLDPPHLSLAKEAQTIPSLLFLHMEFLLPPRQLVYQAVLLDPHLLSAKESQIIPFLLFLQMDFFLPPQQLVDQAALQNPPHLLTAKET
jgi:hypothetical protein